MGDGCIQATPGTHNMQPYRPGRHAATSLLVVSWALCIKTNFALPSEAMKSMQGENFGVQLGILVHHAPCCTTMAPREDQQLQQHGGGMIATEIHFSWASRMVEKGNSGFWKPRERQAGWQHVQHNIPMGAPGCQASLHLK